MTTEKKNNQIAKADAGKPRVSLVPSAIVKCIAPVREYGNNKYPEGGENNWKNVEPTRYVDAMYRHMLDFMDDYYSIDKESGLPHLYHLACNVAFLCDLISMPSDVIKEDQDDNSCEYCEYIKRHETDYPCYMCKHSHLSYFSPRKDGE